MARMYPNLEKSFVDKFTLHTVITGKSLKLLEYLEAQKMLSIIEENELILWNSYFYNKVQHVFLLRLFLPRIKRKNQKIGVEICFKVQSKKMQVASKFKKIREQQFLDFFTWLESNGFLKDSKIIINADILLPVNAKYQFPSLIESAGEPIRVEGMRFGFDKKLKVDTVIIERINNRKRPLRFFVETLPCGGFDKQNFGKDFFVPGINFVVKLAEVFCKDQKRKESV
ncbi:MAG: hypothetical protein GY853_14230 [PVC group bacterium]|nr:hypothetical protein [PVC group bacterium]